MRTFPALVLVTGLILGGLNATTLHAAQTTQESFKPFTGKITHSKVRLRIEPGLDSPVFRQLNQGDMLVVLGESEDFYAVRPPSDAKAFIFRTFVFDNVVEGNKVNVRLQPTLEAPIVAQLNTGDRVEGTISSQNAKWLEITPPPQTRFYISKEYVERIGDDNYLTVMEARKKEADSILVAAKKESQTEFEKAFDQIDIDKTLLNLEYLISHFKDLPDHVNKGEKLLALIKDHYLQRKIAYLENRSEIASEEIREKNQKQIHDAYAKQLLEQDSEPLLASLTEEDFGHVFAKAPETITKKMAAWLPAEQTLYSVWKKDTGLNVSIEDFYKKQKDEAFPIRGIVKMYNRPIKNKPGDYMLIDRTDKLPLGFLYSTVVNLQEYVGQEVTVYVVGRPNQHFAYPAYYTLAVE